MHNFSLVKIVKLDLYDLLFCLWGKRNTARGTTRWYTHQARLSSYMNIKSLLWTWLVLISA